MVTIREQNVPVDLIFVLGTPAWWLNVIVCVSDSACTLIKSLKALYSRSVVLCCAVLCCAVLCCAVLCCAVLC
jgi:hypothetical protein